VSSLCWTKCNWGRFSPNASAFPDNSHFTDCCMFINKPTTDVVRWVSVLTASLNEKSKINRSSGKNCRLLFFCCISIRHRPQRKHGVQKFFTCCRGKRCLSKSRGHIYCKVISYIFFYFFKIRKLS
jgi:hypothetical protein